MSQDSTRKNPEEIELGEVLHKIKSLFKSILIEIIKAFRFLYKHKFILVALFIIGYVGGYFLNSIKEKKYVNEVLVKPNYKSTEYLYSKVDAVDNKLSSNDSIYLKNIFGDNFNLVSSIEVEPVLDIYDLVSQSEDHKQTFQMLFKEEGNLEFLEKPVNIRNYPVHKIKVIVKGKENHQQLTNKFLAFVSQNEYYENLKELLFADLQKQLKENAQMRQQIDSIVENSQSENSPKITTSEISFNGAQSLHELLIHKKRLLADDVKVLKSIATEDEVLKIIDASYQISDKEYNRSYKLLSVVLVLLYCLIFFFRYLSRKALKFTRNN
ncbi:hypothetical protein [Psychroflexus aestuariivivens]|uniref:hypothetical protein n=1 Tax=Psychroflexus aestuariivivens TaxID=1795040 RepID=UPI000FD862DA|nr:hypothetical protein [Psychroflexus aestuariivivens]